MRITVKRAVLKKYSIVLAVFFGLIALVFLTPVSSVLADTNASFTVSLSIGNQNITITIIQNLTSVTPADGSTTTVYLLFNASDGNGFSDINVSSAFVAINLSGVWRNSTPDNCTTVASSGNVSRINCTVVFYYFDSDGIWDLTVNISDKSGSSDENRTRDKYNVTVGTLSAIQISPSSLSFGTALSAGDTNIAAANDPLKVNNTGNQDFTTIDVTALDLAGLTADTEKVIAENFTVNITDEIGTNLTNSTAVTVGGASVTAGNNSFEELYFWLRSLDGSLSPQTYDTTKYGAWNVSVS